MPSILAWVDHDAKARERTLRILSLFRQKDSRDELGLGAVRDSFSDQLFPGTSTIQTRLRYMLFVPWIYRLLEEKQLPSAKFAKEAAKLERELIQPLLDSDDNFGVFGRTAKGKLKRLPSSVYWTGLRLWRILLTPFSQDEYHRRIGDTYRRRESLKVLEKEAKARGDDLDVEQRMAAVNWHPRLPAPPEDFPSKANFALSREEAEFIQDCIQTAFPGSLLSFLALHCEPIDKEEEEVKAPRFHRNCEHFSEQHIELLDHARLFSEVMHGAALSYNFQLARLRNHEEGVIEYQGQFDTWAENLPLEKIGSWDLNRLWELTVGHGHTIAPQTKSFITEWVEHAKTSPRDLLSNAGALELIERREIRLKGPRSRFKNQKALEQWSGASGVSSFTYRWWNVKLLLNDLSQGMSRGEKC
jgi:hypothetical protein